VLANTPPLSDLQRVEPGSNSAIYAADGTRLGFIQSDVARTPKPLSDIPVDLQQGTVAIEDQRFYHHGALDSEGIVRAGVNNLEGKATQGASTITQQLARILYISDPERTFERKVKELGIAEQLESDHSKSWILNEYLNGASYGTVLGRTAVGVEAASQIYFDKSVKHDTLAESALLAGIPQSPSAYNPILNPKGALERRNEVLDKMADQGYISDDTAAETKQQPIDLHPGNKYSEVREPYVFHYVEQELIDEYGADTVRNGGLKVHTTIEPRLQAAAQSAVDSCSVCSTGGPASALASVDPSNGEIVAVASTQRYSASSQFNLATHAQRQPGSSFKVYDLTAAIQQGIDPDTTYYDGSSPKTLMPPDGSTWEVNNAEPGGGGVVPLTAATWESVNVVFAQLGLDVGPEEIARTAYQMGITSPLGIKNGTNDACKSGPDCFIPPADVIGGLSRGVTPLEQANAYATLANGGTHHDATAISKVIFPDGTVDEPSASDGKRVLTPGEAYEVTKVLKGVITSGTGAGYTYMGCDSEAGKTGTSEDLSDAWFVGYTPKYSTAVWTGHPLSRESTGFGGPTSGPIWRSYMESAQGGDCPEFPVPETLPTLSSYHGEHTSSSSSSCTADTETGSFSCGSTSTAPTSTDDSKGDNGGGDNGGGGGNSNYAPGKGQKPAKPAPAPPPAPEPAPVPDPSGGISP
jgi:penicillin-binding protein 1A